MEFNNIKKYTFIDWTQMIPGAIIGGFIMTPGGLALGSDWAKEMQKQKTWKRFCISEFYAGLKDKLPVAKVSRTGVAIYSTNNRELNELLDDSKIKNGWRNVNITINFTVDEPLGLFLGNILRVDGETFVHLLTTEGQEIWICDQTYC